MNLTIEHEGQLKLQPKSLEFWKLIDPRFKYLFKLSLNSPFYLTWNSPVDRKAIRMLPENGEWYAIPTFNIHHPGTWEDSLYQRPELANESTPEGTEVIVISKLDSNIQLANWGKNFLMCFYQDANHFVVSTDAMKRQYLGGK